MVPLFLAYECVNIFGHTFIVNSSRIPSFWTQSNTCHVSNENKPVYLRPRKSNQPWQTHTRKRTDISWTVVTGCSPSVGWKSVLYLSIAVSGDKRKNTQMRKLIFVSVRFAPPVNFPCKLVESCPLDRPLMRHMVEYKREAVRLRMSAPKIALARVPVYSYYWWKAGRSISYPK